MPRRGPDLPDRLHAAGGPERGGEAAIQPEVNAPEEVPRREGRLPEALPEEDHGDHG